MVIGVFMAAFLVGALWYIIGIGNAAVYREYMQDGADAVSFGAAVYHARGMNIIVLINLVMAAVLAVLVAFKIAQMLLVMTNIISCALGAWFNPVCDLTTAAEPEMNTAVNEVETAVDNALRVLKRASDVVAYGAPWLAEAKALTIASNYGTTVKNGWMMSVSQIPGSITPQGSKRYGLPVQDDKFANLCGKAGEDVVDIVFSPLSLVGGDALVGGVKKFVGGAVSGLVSTFPGYFCGGGPAVNLSSATGGWVGGADPTSDKKACESEQAGIPDKKARASFDIGKCIDGRQKARDAAGKSKAMDSGSDRTSKAIYSASRMGDDYFGVFGFTTGDLKNQSDADKGVAVAGWGTKPGDPAVWDQVQFAKSEFFYEPRSDGKTDWSSVSSDCMWNMRWRARLRRFHIPAPEMTSFLFPLVSKIDDAGGGWALKSILNKVLKSDTVTGVINDPVKGVIGGMTDDLIIH
jgi:hypothetical protein